MFKIGDYIMYNKSGVCRVIDIADRTFGGRAESAPYYTLEAVYGTETVFLPVENNSPMLKYRAIISKDEAANFISEIPGLLDRYIMNIPVVEQRELQNFYKSLIASDDIYEWLKILAYILNKKRTMLNGGKKLCQTDKIYEMKAKNLLYGELATALEEDKENLGQELDGKYMK
ncbi:MAG: hypothetical protein II749_03400 [Clostridia bacterium]|nr:hypothetical protein [Clostridia bacterium]